MSIFFLGSLLSALLGWMMAFLSLFLIMLILIQRGKGGGLTGALGGPGGQSAFGSKAGDTFTVITIVIASVWGFTCAFAMWQLGAHTPKTVVNETNIKAGPADKDNEANPIVIPSADSTFGGLGSNTTDGIGSLTTELTPKTTDKPKTDAGEPKTDDDKPKTDAADAPAEDSTTDSETEPNEENSAEPATDGSSESADKDDAEASSESDAGSEDKSSDEKSDTPK